MHVDNMQNISLGCAKCGVYKQVVFKYRWSLEYVFDCMYIFILIGM